VHVLKRSPRVCSIEITMCVFYRDHHVCVLNQTMKLLEIFYKLCCEYFTVGRKLLRNCNAQFDVKFSDVEAPR